MFAVMFPDVLLFLIIIYLKSDVNIRLTQICINVLQFKYIICLKYSNVKDCLWQN